jgi:hypothetical protein
VIGAPPIRPINAIFEVYLNADLLFVGTDMSMRVSLDGGLNWSALKGGMRLVAVTDLVVGVYGRGALGANIKPPGNISRLDTEDSYDKNKINRRHRNNSRPCPDACFERNDDRAGAGAAATDQPRAKSGS